MSDETPLGPDAAPDPVDEAYARAEAVLSDDEARSARRARVLGAVAREGEAPAAPVPSARRPVWRRAGWLAAASVVGLSVFVAVQIFPPPPRPPPNTPANTPANMQGETAPPPTQAAPIGGTP